MREQGIMGDHYQVKASSLKKSKKCKAKGKLNDFVVIDDDNDVIILDFPEALKKKFKHSGTARGRNKLPSQGIISIDDEESDNMNAPGSSSGGAGDLDSDASSPASEILQRSTKLDDEDECQVIQDKASAFRFSKCKQSFSKVPARNRYGLSSESRSPSPESNCSDCEVIELCTEKYRELWEKASLRKKNCRSSYKSHLEEDNSTATPHCATNQRAEVEQESEHYVKNPVCSAPSNELVETENFSTFAGTGESDSGDACFNIARPCPHLDTEEISDGRSSSATKPSTTAGAQNSQWKACFQCRYGTFEEEAANSHFMEKEQNDVGVFSKSLQDSELQSDPSKADLQNEDHAVCKGGQPGKTEDHHGQAMFWENYEKSSSVPATGDKQSACGTNFKRKKTQAKIESSAQFDEAKIEHGKLLSTAFVKQFINPTASTSGYAPGHDGTSVERDIIIDREKFKETIEYRRAEEAEWKSRQKQLQIQAEEAQRLRKKRKGEILRLLDMERRQKQRVEEMRETQKKDEENLNLKERLRAEVRRELNKLEATCFDMASLLRGLGIPVEGGAFPLSHEVHAAYKRALLKFHPDRASQADLRKQVEAEEKFKLISRMKEKFLSISGR